MAYIPTNTLALALTLAIVWLGSVASIGEARTELSAQIAVNQFIDLADYAQTYR